MKDLQNIFMKKIIVIRGPLGVGKTTVSKILAQKLDVEYLSLDKIIDDNNLNSTARIPLENFLKANNIIQNIATKSKKTFIIDGCFYYQEQIDDLTQKFHDDILFFSLTTNVEKCIERDAKREKVYGEDSARYVYMVTTKIKVGHEIDTSKITAEEAVEEIMKII
jgi:shikimate kinase